MIKYNSAHLLRQQEALLTQLRTQQLNMALTQQAQRIGARARDHVC